MVLPGSCAQGDEQLTLDAAVTAALQHNRQLRSARIDVLKIVGYPDWVETIF